MIEEHQEAQRADRSVVTFAEPQGKTNSAGTVVPQETKAPKWLRILSSRHDRLKPLRDWLAFLVTVVGLTVGFSTFYWPNIVEPQRVPPELSIDTSLTKISQTSTFDIFDAKIHLTNTSGTRVYSLGSWYEVVGYHVGVKPDLTFDNEMAENANDPAYLDNNNLRVLHRDIHVDRKSAYVIATGKAFNRSDWWDKDAQQTEDFLVYVRRDRFGPLDYIQFVLHSVSARTQRGIVAHPFPQNGGVSYVINIYRPIAFGNRSSASNWVTYSRLGTDEQWKIQEKFGLVLDVARCQTLIDALPASTSIPQVTPHG